MDIELAYFETKSSSVAISLRGIVPQLQSSTQPMFQSQTSRSGQLSLYLKTESMSHVYFDVVYSDVIIFRTLTKFHIKVIRCGIRTWESDLLI